jgi:hypothetical protein
MAAVFDSFIIIAVSSSKGCLISQTKVQNIVKQFKGQTSWLRLASSNSQLNGSLQTRAFHPLVVKKQRNSQFLEKDSERRENWQNAKAREWNA